MILLSLGGKINLKRITPQNRLNTPVEMKNGRHIEDFFLGGGIGTYFCDEYIKFLSRDILLLSTYILININTYYVIIIQIWFWMITKDLQIGHLFT